MNLQLKAVCSSLQQKKYFAKRLKEEFSTIGKGIISILFERYGTWQNPKGGENG